MIKLDSLINWASLAKIIKPLKHESNKIKGSRPGWDPLIIIKCLILQSLYNISDDSCEYQINDRLSFKRFLGIDASQKAPDAKTLWFWRERIKHKNLDSDIFQWFNRELDKSGYVAKSGQIIDASFIPTHKPSGKNKKQLGSEIPLSRSQDSQIDKDSSFTKKGGVTYHGYKNHIKIDNKYKLIRKQIVSTAKLHDSQALQELIDIVDKDQIWADSAYRSKECEKSLKKNNLKSEIHERGYKNKPLTDKQKSDNQVKSRVRVRVEHVFGHMVTAMGGKMIHTIGLDRARVKISFKNLAYNMQRFIFLQSRKTLDKCA